MKLEDRKAKALELRSQGYNCAQTVLMVFSDVTGLDEATSARIASGLGAGVGASGEICGAINAAALAEGMRHGDRPADKAEAMKAVRRLVDSFAAGNDGCVRCKELKGIPGKRPCNDLILQAIEIFDGYLR